MLFGLKAFPFKKLLINLLIFSAKIIKLILNTLWFIIASILILLKFIILILGKNLATKMSIFIILLFIKGSLINFLRSSR